MADTKYSVSWDAYQKSICNGLSSLQQRGEFVDMTLAAEGHHVKVHQMVMSLVSPYIRDLIGSAACPHPVVFLNKLSYETLQSILQYAYTGEVVVSNDKLQEFLTACKDLHIRGLESLNSMETPICETDNQRTNKTTKPSEMRPTTTLKKPESKSLSIESQQDEVDDDIKAEESHMDYSMGSDIDDDITQNPFDNNEELKTSNETMPNKKEADMVYFSISAVGTAQIVLNRYIYNLRSKRRTGQVMWRCSSFSRGRCRAYIVVKDGKIIKRPRPTPTQPDSDSSDTGSPQSSESEELMDQSETTPTLNTTPHHTNWIDVPMEPTSLPFLGSPGILLLNSSEMAPLDYFKIFFDINFLTTLAEMTNDHAHDVIGRGISSQSRLQRWKETNPEELLTFLGVVFFMGTVRLNQINDYWAKSNLVKFNLTEYMSRNRFLLILRMLYFQHRNANANMDAKVEWLINYFNNVMKTTVYPQKEMTVDESMAIFRGRLVRRQYIKNKKLYLLADPKGLVHRIHLYVGSGVTQVKGRGRQTVALNLLNDYLDAGHSIYMDSFYNSVDLAELLLERKTYCTGTLRPNRKRNPVVVTTKILARGSSIYQTNGKGVCVMKWKDRKDVLTVSTEHTPDFIPVVSRQGRVVSKPNMVHKYNTFKKGVDRHNQMLAYYPCANNAFRWYKKIGIHVLQMMFINAYFLYKQGSGVTLSLEEFRQNVLTSLLLPKIRAFSPQSPTHMPQELPRNQKGVLRRRRCSRCWNMYQRRKDSAIYCQDCDKALCIRCYGPYHIENKLLP